MPSLAQPAFPDDDGRADPALAAALERHAGQPGAAAVLSALSRSRLLVPVVAVRPDDGDKEADMSAVLMQGRDGRRALLAFSSLDNLIRWDPDARPVPVTTADAARAAVSEDAAALLLDVAGPVAFVVSGDDLAELAAGRLLVRAGESYAWAAPSGEAPRR